MFRSRTQLVWLGVVALLMVLSVDWWWWDLDARIGGWLPVWVLWSMALQFSLAYALYQIGEEAADG